MLSGTKCLSAQTLDGLSSFNSNQEVGKQGHGAGEMRSSPGARALRLCAGERPGARQGRKGHLRHEVRRRSNRREGKGERGVRVALRVARAYGHGQSKVGQPPVPAFRRAYGGRAHAAVLAPRVGGVRRRSLGQAGIDADGGVVPSEGEERAKRSERLRNGRGSPYAPGEGPGA